LALSGLLNPFSIDNRTHPFVVAKIESWRTVQEWLPVWQYAGFGTIEEFFVIAGVMAGLMSVRVIVDLVVRRDRLSVEHLGMAAFALILTILVIYKSGGVPSDPNYRAFPREYRETMDTVQKAYWMLGILAFAAATCAWVFLRRMRRPSADGIALVVFEVAVTLASIYMAATSRRFIPLAIILSAPVLAVQLDWALREGRSVIFAAVAGVLAYLLWDVFKGPGLLYGIPIAAALCGGVWLAVKRPFWPDHYTWATAVAAAAVCVPVAAKMRTTMRYYDPDNPGVPAGTVAQKMCMYHNAFAPYAAEFLKLNDIGGRYINEWRWEGFLRWNCPKLKAFMGGRAQQAYDESTFRLRQVVLVGRLVDRDPREIVAGPTGDVAVTPADMNHPFVRANAPDPNDPNTPWRVIHTGEAEFVLAKVDSPETGELVNEVARGRRFANTSCAIATALKMHLAVMPWDQQNEAVIAALLRGGWAIIHGDGHDVVLADPGAKDTLALIEAARAGALRHPNSATAKLSRVLCLATTRQGLRLPESAQPNKPQHEGTFAAARGAARESRLPDAHDAYMSAAAVALQGGKRDEAFDAYLEAARMWWQVGRWTRAMESYRRANDIQASSEAQEGMATAQRQISELTGAIEEAARERPMHWLYDRGVWSLVNDGRLAIDWTVRFLLTENARLDGATADASGLLDLYQARMSAIQVLSQVYGALKDEASRTGRADVADSYAREQAQWAEKGARTKRKFDIILEAWK
jgi:tetratricopeptide (TPR) repeat protein